MAQLEIEPAPIPAFIMDDGEVFEIPGLPEDVGRACALASEATLKKFWDVPVTFNEALNNWAKSG